MLWAAPSPWPRACGGAAPPCSPPFPPPSPSPPPRAGCPAPRGSRGWAPGAGGLVPSPPVPAPPDVFVSLDAASPGRLGELAPLLDDAGTSVVVDHHASNPGFGDLRLVDGAAPATVALVAGLLDELGVTLDPQLAT